MTGLATWLSSALAVTFGIWLLTFCVGLLSRRAFERRAGLRDRLASAISLRALSNAQEAPGPVLRGVSARVIERIVLETKLPPAVEASCCRHLLERRGPEGYRRKARAHKGEESRWRRIEALRILALGGDEGAFTLLEAALRDRDDEVVGAAVNVLGRVPDRRAAEMLVRALRGGLYADSRIVTFLDAFPLDIGDLIWPLHNHDGARLRAWGAGLLHRYGHHPAASEALLRLTEDGDAFVRKAALVSLGVVGGPGAVRAAQARLTDRVGLVRAHAARALGALGACETAWQVAPLLGDREWWVRLAARQVLESFGKEAAWVLIPLLASDDPFLRDGAEAVMTHLVRRPDPSPAANWLADRLREVLPAAPAGEVLA